MVFLRHRALVIIFHSNCFWKAHEVLHKYSRVQGLSHPCRSPLIRTQEGGGGRVAVAARLRRKIFTPLETLTSGTRSGSTVAGKSSNITVQYARVNRHRVRGTKKSSRICRTPTLTERQRNSRKVRRKLRSISHWSMFGFAHELRQMISRALCTRRTPRLGQRS